MCQLQRREALAWGSSGGNTAPLLLILVDDVNLLAGLRKLQALPDFEFLLGRILFQPLNTLLLFFNFAVHFLRYLFEFLDLAPLGQEARNPVRSL